MGTKASKLVKFWDELWADMKVKIDPLNGKIECWKDDYDYYYFFQDDTNNYFWCDFEKIWSFFDGKLGLEYTEIQELIQHMVSKTLNCKVNTPWLIWPQDKKKVGKTLKCDVNNQ